MPLDAAMNRWILYVVLALLVGGAWVGYSRTGKDYKAKEALVEELRMQGHDEEAGKAASDAKGLEGQRTMLGILLTFLSAGLVGIFFVLQILPAFAQRITHAVYDSAEMMENDVMHDARSLLAQGDYEGAIHAFKQAAAAEPLNRLPWVEIAKIYKDNLGDPDSAVATIRHALESQAWEVNDAAYFLFRLAELYNEVYGDRDTAVAIMNQVMEQFPGTRHSANANHRIHEWAAQDEAAALAQEQGYADQAAEEAQPGIEGETDLEREEREYLERMHAAEMAEGGVVEQEPQPEGEYDPNRPA